MANQMVALQARGPQLPDMGALTARYSNMMANMANMEKMRTERGITANIRGVMGDPSFNPSDAGSLNKLIGLGPAGTEAASKVMQAQELSGKLTDQNIDLAKKRVTTVGVNLIGLLRDPSDKNLAQVAETFKAVGLAPSAYKDVLAQISQIPDANERKIFTLQFIAQSTDARDALKYVMPDVKSEKVGDASVFIDNNANSPTFGKELFRITASPEQVKLSPQVVDSTLYNVNPLTGAASEATIGDAMTGLVPQPRTTTRTDSGVVSPYAIQNAAAPGMGEGLPGPRGAGINAAVPRAAAPMGAPARGATPVEIALQTNPGAMEDNEYTRSLPGYAGASGRFATFDTPQAGIAAQENMLRRSYVGRGINTVNKIIDKYTPASKENPEAGRNSYKTYVAGKLGIDLNTPITAAQVPVLAAAMRDIETGNRSGGAGAGATITPTPTVAATPPRTVAEAQREKAYKLVAPIIGYDIKTGVSRVEDLISASTSGGAEMIGADVVGFFGKGTPGREALARLKGIGKNMTFEALRGKLGTAVSDKDVQLVEDKMGDITNGNTPANVRLAVWQNEILPILLRGANLPPKAAVDRLRKDPSLRGAFDAKYGPGKAKEVLGR